MADSTDSATEQQPGSGLGIVHRPHFQLRSLPINFRWEVTRRHPYYQHWWKAARDHYQKMAVEHAAEPYIRQAAVAILGAIGVSGLPPDPASDFDQLGSEQLNVAWLSGAIHPITFRGLAALLMTALPKETLGRVGLKFVEAACDDKESEPPKTIKKLNELCALDKPGLDEYADEPIVSINPAASKRQIEAAATQLMRQWKEERELSEKRDRADKYADYLLAWDLREGWHGGQYDPMQELSLKEVAIRLKLAVNTVHNHYRSAFELIVGHPYSPELWYRVFGFLKISTLFGTELGAVSRNRPSTSSTRRDVPESVVKPVPNGGHVQGFITSRAVSDGGHGYMQLVADIRALLAKGWTDEKIGEELDLSKEGIAAVNYLRQRHDDAL